MRVQSLFLTMCATIYHTYLYLLISKVHYYLICFGFKKKSDKNVYIKTTQCTFSMCYPCKQSKLTVKLVWNVFKQCRQEKSVGLTSISSKPTDNTDDVVLNPEDPLFNWFITEVSGPFLLWGPSWQSNLLQILCISLVVLSWVLFL